MVLAAVLPIPGMSITDTTYNTKLQKVTANVFIDPWDVYHRYDLQCKIANLAFKFFCFRLHSTEVLIPDMSITDMTYNAKLQSLQI